MNENDMAMQIAKRVIRCEARTAVLEAELDKCRSDGKPVPWRRIVHQALMSDPFVRESGLRLGELQREFDAASADDSLIRILHTHLREKDQTQGK